MSILVVHVLYLHTHRTIVLTHPTVDKRMLMVMRLVMHVILMLTMME